MVNRRESMTVRMEKCESNPGDHKPRKDNYRTRRRMSWLRQPPRHFVGGTPSVWKTRKQLIALTKATFPIVNSSEHSRRLAAPFYLLGRWDLVAGRPDTPSAFVGRVVMCWVYAFAHGLLLSATALPFHSFFGATTLIGGLGHVAYGTGACALVHYETTILCVM